MLAPDVVRILVSGFHDAGERIAGIDFVAHSQIFRLGRDQRRRAPTPYPDFDQRAAFELGALLDEPPQLEATVFVDKRRVFDLRIGRYERLVEIPRAVGRVGLHNFVIRALVYKPGHVANMGTVLARKVLEGRLYAVVQGNIPAVSLLIAGSALQRLSGPLLALSGLPSAPWATR